MTRLQATDRAVSSVLLLHASDERLKAALLWLLHLPQKPLEEPSHEAIARISAQVARAIDGHREDLSYSDVERRARLARTLRDLLPDALADLDHIGALAHDKLEEDQLPVTVPLSDLADKLQFSKPHVAQ